MSETETYRVEVICNNCASPQHDSEEETRDYPGFTIPKGTAVGVFLRDKTCKNCGLTGTLRRRFHPEPLFQK